MTRYGVVLLEDTEVIFRIYEATEQEWKLFHYHSLLIPSPSHNKINDILELIGNFFTTDYAQHIAEWKIGSRHHSKQLTKELEQALSITIEPISPHREQELLCKGMFTELW